MYVRIQPDISKIERTYIYKVSESTKESSKITKGSIVRVVVKGKKQKGWVVEMLDDIAGLPDEDLDPLKIKDVLEFVSVGPPEYMVDFAYLLSRHYLVSPVNFLRSASPLRLIQNHTHQELKKGDGYIAKVIYVDPRANRQSLISEAIAKDGSTLLVSPDSHFKLSDWLKQSGKNSTVYMREGKGLKDTFTDSAKPDCVIIGSRSALFAPSTDTKSIVLLDDSYEQLSEDRSPQWRAIDVAKLLAQFLQIELTIITSVPSVSTFDMSTEDKREMKQWPKIDIEDKRNSDPVLGDTSKKTVDLIYNAEKLALDVAIVINNKSISKFLVCKSCETIATCENCAHSVSQVESQSELECLACNRRRPLVCLECKATSFKRYRRGTKSSVDSYKAMFKNFAVHEVTSSTVKKAEENIKPGKSNIFVATEAIFHSTKLCNNLGAVVFQDIDTVMFRSSIVAFDQTLVLINRALRAIKKSEIKFPILLSTKHSGHELFTDLSKIDLATNLKRELEVRKSAGLFPYFATAEIKSDAAAIEELNQTIDKSLIVGINAGESESTLLIKAQDHEALSLGAYDDVRKFASRNKFSISVDNYE